MATALLAPAANAVKADPSGTTLKRVLKRLTKIPTGPPGAIAIVQRQGERRMVIKAGFGDLMPTERPHPTDHMRIASVAKAFSGAVALSLVSEGRLTLDTTLGERLPDMPGPWLSVTLRDLLNHTSGIPDYTADPDFLAFISANPQATIAHRDLIDFVADEPLHFTPGTAYEYSNTRQHHRRPDGRGGDGRDVREPARDARFRAARHARHQPALRFSHPRAVHPRLRHRRGHAARRRQQRAQRVAVWASGGIISTPADLNRFARGYVGGKLFDKEERTAQFQFFPGRASDPPGPGENSAGLALFKYRTPCGVVFGHTGNFPGYTQFMAATRNGKASITVSINEQVSPTAGDPVVFQRLLKAEKVAVCTALARAR